MFHGHLDCFQKPPLGGKSTQNRETMALWTLTTVNLFYFYHVWGPVWIEIHWNRIWLGPDHIWLHPTLEVVWPHDMILEVSCDGLWTLSFGLSQFHGHGSWLMCDVALTHKDNHSNNKKTQTQKKKSYTFLIPVWGSTNLVVQLSYQVYIKVAFA